MIREAWAQKDENQKTAPQRRATVIKQYPHHVLVENAKGTRCCITNAEIYGTEKRKGVQEAAGMRDSSGKEVDVKESTRRVPALEFGQERRRRGGQHVHIRSIREGGIWEYIGHQKLKRS